MKNTFKRCASVVLFALLLAGLTLAILPAIAETVDTTATVAAPVAPTSVALDQKGTIKLGLGDKLTLNATLYPEGAQTTLKWSSSKQKIAKVSGGVVTAKKVGTTTITVTTANKKKAKVKIKVYDPYKPTSIHFDVSGGTPTVMTTQQIQLNAVMSPATAKSKLKWKTSNKWVAVVNSKGVVTGRKPGKCTITVTTRNKKKAKIKVRVTDDGNQPITTTPDYNLPYVLYACKNTHTIAVLAKDANGAWSRVIRKFPTAMGRKNVTDVGVFFLSKKERWHKWGGGYSPYATRISVGIYLHGPMYKSKNHNTIRPSYYNVIGKDGSSGCLRTTCGCAGFIYYNCPVGTQLIIAQNSRYSAPRPKKLSKKAKKDPTDPGSNNFDILVTSFTTNPAQVTLPVGGTQKVTPVNVMPLANTNHGKFTYVSTNKAIATVNDSGVITAVAPGACSIVVTAADDFKAAYGVPVTVVGAETVATKDIAAEADALPDDIVFEADEAAADEVIIAGTESTETVQTPAVAAQVPAEGEAAAEEGETAEPSPTAETEETTVVAGTEEDVESITEEGDFWFSAEPVEEDLSEPVVEEDIE